MRMCNNFNLFLLVFSFVVLLTLYDIAKRPNFGLSEDLLVLLDDLSEWFSFVDYYGMLEYLGEDPFSDLE